MWTAMTTYLAQGGRLMYLGGNGFYWRTAIHPEKPWLVELRRAESGGRDWDSEPGEGHMSFTGGYDRLLRRAAPPPQELGGGGVGRGRSVFDIVWITRRRAEKHRPRARFRFGGCQ